MLKTGIRHPQDAQTVFATRKGVCEGYANLFRALGQAIGEDIVVVVGKIRRDQAPKDLIPVTLRLIHSDYDWTLHAWNAVKISGKWHLVDVTWDDSKTNYKAEYIMAPHKVMSMSHVPHQLSWQLLPLSENYDTFEKNPILTPHFFIERLKMSSPNQYESEVKEIALITIESPRRYQRKILAFFAKEENKLLLWDNQKRKTEDIKKCRSERDVVGKTQIYCQFTQPGVYQVFLYSLGQTRQDINDIGQLKFHAL